MKTKNLLLIVSLILLTGSISAQQAIPNMPWVDLSAQTERHVIIAEGTKDLYNGHPTTVMLDDNKTIYCTWSYDHGGKVGFIAKSSDAGLTWEMLDTPADWPGTSNCPSIYNLQDKEGKQRLMVFAAHPQMTQSYSEDLGKTWTSVRSLGKPNVMAYSSIVKLDNGDYIGFYHRGHNDQYHLEKSLNRRWPHLGRIRICSSCRRQITLRALRILFTRQKATRMCSSRKQQSRQFIDDVFR